MAKIVIIEGIDHIGKSAFVQQYCEMLKQGGLNVVMGSRKMMTSFADRSNEALVRDIFEIRHVGALDAFANMFHTLIENNMLKDNDVYVLDRFHPSEYAYGTATRADSFKRVFRDEETFMRYTTQFEKNLEEIFGMDNVFLVLFALSPLSDPVDDEFVSKEDLKKVNEAYIKYASMTAIKNTFLVYLQMDENNKTDILDRLHSVYSYTVGQNSQNISLTI